MMKASSRKELYKLREIVHFLLQGKKCSICKKPLSATAEAFNEHGNSVGPKFADTLTIHHLDGNHENNEQSNKSLVHTPCHKSYHRRLSNTLRAARKNNSIDDEGCSDPLLDPDDK